eukprot:4829947-Pyramimonas_sp.AAC.1
MLLPCLPLASWAANRHASGNDGDAREQHLDSCRDYLRDRADTRPGNAAPCTSPSWSCAPNPCRREQ